MRPYNSLIALCSLRKPATSTVSRRFAQCGHTLFQRTCALRRPLRPMRASGCCIELTFTVTVQIQRFDVARYSRTRVHSRSYKRSHVISVSDRVMFTLEIAELTVSMSSTGRSLTASLLTHTSRKNAFASHEPAASVRCSAREKEKHATLSFEKLEHAR